MPNKAERVGGIAVTIGRGLPLPFRRLNEAYPESKVFFTRDTVEKYTGRPRSVMCESVVWLALI